MKKRGQALVEFIIILPVFLFIVLATFDVGKILYFSNQLENKLDDVILMYRNKETYEIIKENISKDIKKTSLEINEDDKYIEFKIIKKVDIVTPGLNLIFDTPYKVEAKRVVYNE